MVIYTLTKFGADLQIFVDARVLTRKLWTDGHQQMVSNHNSLLSTPCSVELKNKNDVPFVAFYDMRAVTFVLPDELADVSITGLQWFILIPQLNQCLTGQVIPIPNPIYIKKNIWNKNHQPAAILQITWKAIVRLPF